MRIVTWVSRYMAHDDPRTALANLVAILIVSNQPFYPLYVYAIAGSAAWVTVVTFISTPFFAAVPWLSRRNAIAGRLLMCLAGTLNTVLCVWAFGAASGVVLFYLPCILLGVLLFAATSASRWRSARCCRCWRFIFCAAGSADHYRFSVRTNMHR